MPNVPPQPKVNQIAWFENRLPLWAVSPSQFGATPAQITALSTAVTAARKAYNDAQAARVASKAATVSESQAVATMLTNGRNLVNIMKSFIENSNNSALWGQAGLEPDARGGPGTAPAPNAPFKLGASLDSVGNVIVTWKASQPAGVSGVIYSVQRALDGGNFVLLDSVGEKQFVDEALPAGTQSVSYTVKSRRGGKSSAWSEALVLRFGRVGVGGGLTIMSMQSGPTPTAAKLAA